MNCAQLVSQNAYQINQSTWQQEVLSPGSRQFDKELQKEEWTEFAVDGMKGNGRKLET